MYQNSSYPYTSSFVPKTTFGFRDAGEQPSLPVGDVTGDGSVDVSDVNAAIDIILKVKTAADYPGNADLTGDDAVDVSDVNAIINLILTKGE